MTNSRSIEEISAKIEQQRTVFILRAPAAAPLVPLVHAIWEAGGACVEITYNTPGALDIVASLVKTAPQGKFLGMGTLSTPPEVREAICAGASFLVTPVFTSSLARACRESGRVTITGALSPTEIFSAGAAGAHFVKVFPAGTPEYLRQVCAPLNKIKMIAVGGVRTANARSFLDAGAVAVGVGGGMFRTAGAAFCQPAEAARRAAALLHETSIGEGGD